MWRNILIMLFKSSPTEELHEGLPKPTPNSPDLARPKQDRKMALMAVCQTLQPKECTCPEAEQCHASVAAFLRPADSSLESLVELLRAWSDRLPKEQMGCLSDFAYPKTCACSLTYQLCLPELRFLSMIESSAKSVHKSHLNQSSRCTRIIKV